MEHDELKPRSWDRRETTIKCHIEAYALGLMQIQAIGTPDIEKKHIAILLKEDKPSGSSIKKVVDVLNAAYAWAVLQGKVSTNPSAPIKETLMKRIARKNGKIVEAYPHKCKELFAGCAADYDQNRQAEYSDQYGTQDEGDFPQCRTGFLFWRFAYISTYICNDAGARVEEIVAYIGDLESTKRLYYIAIRKKVNVQGIEKQIVPLPNSIRETE